jgi:signal transduction histidine kinase
MRTNPENNGLTDKQKMQLLSAVFSSKASENIQKGNGDRNFLVSDDQIATLFGLLVRHDLLKTKKEALEDLFSDIRGVEMNLQNGEIDADIAVESVQNLLNVYKDMEQLSMLCQKAEAQIALRENYDNSEEVKNYNELA